MELGKHRFQRGRNGGASSFAGSFLFSNRGGIKVRLNRTAHLADRGQRVDLLEARSAFLPALMLFADVGDPLCINAKPDSSRTVNLVNLLKVVLFGIGLTFEEQSLEIALLLSVHCAQFDFGRLVTRDNHDAGEESIARTDALNGPVRV